MIIINFKNYKFGKEAIELSRTIEIYCPKAIVSVPIVDIAEIVKNTNLTVYAQHVDYNEQGRSTGAVIPEILESAGAKGSLLNHSEHPVKIADIKKTIDRCHNFGLQIIVCISRVSQARKLAKFKPYAIAFEDPQLIATGKPITYYKSREISEFADSLKGTGVTALCGAGISSSEDVKVAKDLGCNGILVSSAIANSKHPEKFLKEAGVIF